MIDWLGMIPRPRVPRPELRAQVLARALAPVRRPPVWAYAAAAALVLAVAGAAWASWRIGHLEDARTALERRVRAVEDTLRFVRGHHTRLVQIPVTTGGRRGQVAIFVDTVAHRWLVRCENLAPNDPGETYQLWFVTETGMIAAQLMPMDTDETMLTVLDMPAAGTPVMGAAMSIEPRTGSLVMRGRLVFKQLL